MVVVIQDSFTREEAKKAGGAQCVTPQSFGRIHEWKNVEVSGLDYYVKKAVKLGAIGPKKTRSKKVESKEEVTKEAGE